MFSMEEKRQRSYWLIPIAVFLLGSVPGLFLADCFWRDIFGFPCPTCGMTRAFQGLIRGDAARAWQMHPLIFIFIPLAIASVIWAVFLFLKRRRDPEHFVWPTKHLRLAGLAVVSLVFAVYIVRMIWLFPTKEPLSWNDRAIIPLIVQTILAFFRR